MALLIQTVSDSKQAQNDLQKLKLAVDGVRKSTEGFQQKLMQFGKGIVTYGGFGVAIKGFMDLDDSLTNLENRIRTTTATQAEFNTAFGNVASIAVKTRSDLSATAQLYTRLSSSGKVLHATQAQVAKATETVAKSLAVGGASANEARSAMLQFSQAMAAGRLGSDEFASLMENAPTLMASISKGMGISLQQMYKMRDEGTLASSKVFSAIINQADAIDSSFSKLKVTYGSAFENLSTSMKLLFKSVKSYFFTGTSGFATMINDWALQVADFAKYFSFYMLKARTAVALFTIKGMIFFEDLWDSIRSAGSKAFQGLIAIIGKISPSLQKSILSMMGYAKALGTVFTAVFNKISTDISSLGFGKTLVSYLKIAVEAIVSIFNGLQNFLTPIRFENIFPDLDTTIAVVKRWVQTVERWFFWLYEKIIGHSWVPDLINGIIMWFGKLFGNPLKFVGGFVQKVSEHFKGLRNALGLNTDFKEFDGFHSILEKLLKVVNQLVASWKEMRAASSGSLNLLPKVRQRPGFLSSMFKKTPIGRGVGFSKQILSGGFVSDTLRGGSGDDMITGADVGPKKPLISTWNLPEQSMFEKLITFLTRLFKQTVTFIKGIFEKTKIGENFSKLAEAFKSSKAGQGARDVTDKFNKTPFAHFMKQALGIKDTTAGTLNGRVISTDAEVGSGPWRYEKKRPIFHDIVNAFPVEMQLPIVTAVTAIIAGAIALAFENNHVKDILLTALTTVWGLVIAKVIDEKVVHDQLTKVLNGFLHGINAGISLIFNGNVAKDPFGFLAIIAKMALLFESGREFFGKIAVGAVTSPVKGALAANDFFDLNRLKRSAKKLDTQIAKTGTLAEITKEISVASQGYKKSVENLTKGMDDAGRKIGPAHSKDDLTRMLTGGSSTLPMSKAQSKQFAELQAAHSELNNLNMRRNISKPLEDRKTVLNKSAEHISGRLTEQRTAIIEGLHNTFAGAGGIIGTVAGFQLGESIAAGMAADTPSWVKAGITMAGAFGGQAVGASIGVMASQLIVKGFSLIGGVIAAAFASPWLALTVIIGTLGVLLWNYKDVIFKAETWAKVGGFLGAAFNTITAGWAQRQFDSIKGSWQWFWERNRPPVELKDPNVQVGNVWGLNTKPTYNGPSFTREQNREWSDRNFNGPLSRMRNGGAPLDPRVAANPTVAMFNNMPNGRAQTPITDPRAAAKAQGEQSWSDFLNGVRTTAKNVFGGKGAGALQPSQPGSPLGGGSGSDSLRGGTPYQNALNSGKSAEASYGVIAKGLNEHSATLTAAATTIKESADTTSGAMIEGSSGLNRTGGGLGGTLDGFDFSGKGGSFGGSGATNKSRWGLPTATTAVLNGKALGNEITSPIISVAKDIKGGIAAGTAPVAPAVNFTKEDIAALPIATTSKIAEALDNISKFDSLAARNPGMASSRNAAAMAQEWRGTLRDLQDSAMMQTGKVTAAGIIDNSLSKDPKKNKTRAREEAEKLTMGDAFELVNSVLPDLQLTLTEFNNFSDDVKNIVLDQAMAVKLAADVVAKLPLGTKNTAKQLREVEAGRATAYSTSRAVLRPERTPFADMKGTFEKASISISEALFESMDDSAREFVIRQSQDIEKMRQRLQDASVVGEARVQLHREAMLTTKNLTEFITNLSDVWGLNRIEAISKDLEKIGYSLGGNELLRFSNASLATVSDYVQQLKELDKQIAAAGDMVSERDRIGLQDRRDKLSDGLDAAVIKASRQKFAKEAGQSLADSIHETFTSALSDFIKGKKSLKDVLISVVDSFTNQIVDTMVKGFSDTIFGKGTKIHSVLSTLGGSVYSDVGAATGDRVAGKGSSIFGKLANSKLVQGTLGAVGGLLGIGGSAAYDFTPKTMDWSAADIPVDALNFGSSLVSKNPGEFKYSSDLAQMPGDENKFLNTPNPMDQIGPGMVNLAAAINGNFPTLTESLVSKLPSMLDGLKGLFSGGGGAGGGGGIMDLLKGGIGKIGDLLKGGSAGAWGFLGSIFGKVLGGAFASGGVISGPGTGTSDSILAKVSKGEFVINAAATRRNMPLIKAINDNKFDLQAFAAGGLVNSSTAALANSQFVPVPVIARGTLNQSQVKPSSSTGAVVNLQIVGDVSRQTKAEVMKMLPSIAQGVNSHNREIGYR